MKNITKEELKIKLEELCDQVRTNEAFADKLYAIGLTDGPMADMLYSFLDPYVLALAQLYGKEGNDIESFKDWISWFIWENRFGSQELEASKGKDTPMKPIKTIDDLIEVIG